MAVSAGDGSSTRTTASASHSRAAPTTSSNGCHGQLLGRKFTGCEGTNGVFLACDVGCEPCYHGRPRAYRYPRRLAASTTRSTARANPASRIDWLSPLLSMKSRT